MIIIKNGTIHNGLGNIINGKDILIEDGKIAKIAENIKKPNAKIVDATNKLILPGFIESISTWGIKGPGWEDNDSEENSKSINPNLNIIYSFDPIGMTYQQVYKYGITSAGIAPGPKNIIGGQMSVVKTYGTNPYKMLVKEKAALVGSITSPVRNHYKGKNMMPMTKMGIFSLLEETLKKGKIEKSQNKTTEEAIQNTLNKVTPFFINCNTKAEIAALKMALTEYDLDLVYTGAYEIQEDIISPSCKGIILGDLTNLMTTGVCNTNIKEIKKLIEKGLNIAISSGGDNLGSGKESLLWNSILWHKKGLDTQQVLKMITSIPAKILGVESKIGAIKENLDADLSIWDQNPIESFEAHLEKVYISGEDILSTKDERGGIYW